MSTNLNVPSSKGVSTVQAPEQRSQRGRSQDQVPWPTWTEDDSVPDEQVIRARRTRDSCGRIAAESLEITDQSLSGARRPASVAI